MVKTPSTLNTNYELDEFLYVTGFEIFIAMLNPKENWIPEICRKIIENETENCNIGVQIPNSI